MVAWAEAVVARAARASGREEGRYMVVVCGGLE